MKKVYARDQYCLGCKLCEVYCITSHSRSGDVVKAHKQEQVTPGIIIESRGQTSFALQCRHCDDAPCVKACISGALHKDSETGVVTCDTGQCVGCWTCIMSCPYGVINRDQYQHKVISKCDLCLEDGQPACVAHCPNGALVYREQDQEEGVS